MNNENNPFEFMVTLIFGTIIASAVLGKMVPRFGSRLLSILTGWEVLVPDPVIALPGTNVGLDAARLVVLIGILVAALGFLGRRRRGGEERR